MTFKGKLAELVVRLVGETKDFQHEMSESAKKVKSLGDDLTSSGKKMTMGMTVPLVAAGTAAVSFASSLDESRNKTTVVFDEMSSSMLEFGSTSATALGMAEQKSLAMGSVYGTLLKGAEYNAEATADWSQQLLQLTADYSSFHDLSMDESFEKIRAAMVGSSEPILSLGKDMRQGAVEAYALEQGMIAAGETMDANTLMAARLGWMFEQSSDEMGDFQRTSEGVANSSRIVTAQLQGVAAGLGQELIPMVQDTLGVVIPLLDAFNELPESTKKYMIVMAGGAAAAGPFMSVTGGLISNLTTMGNGFTALSRSGTKLWGNMNTLVSPAAALSTAFVAISAAGYKIYETSQLVKAGQDDVRESIAGNLDEAQNAESVYKTWATQLNILNDTYEDSNAIARLFIGHHKNVVNSIEEMGIALAGTGASYDEYLVYMEEAIMQTGWLTEEELMWMNSQPDRQAALIDLISGYGLLSEELFDTAGQTAFLAEIEANSLLQGQEYGLMMAAQAEGAEAMAYQQQAAANAAERLAEVQAAAQEAADETASSYMSLAQSLKDATNTEVARTEIGLLEEMWQKDEIDRGTYLASVSEIGLAFGLMDEKSAALAGNLPIMNGLMMEGVIPTEDLDEALGLLMDEAADGVVDWEALLEQMDITPESAEAVRESMANIRSENLELMTANENLLTSWETLNDWAENNIIDMYINQHVTTITSGGGSDDGPGVPGYDDYFRANGGPVLAGQSYVVNEMGRGEMFVPQQNGYVLSRGDAMQASQSGNNEAILHEFQLLRATLAQDIVDAMATR